MLFTDLGGGKYLRSQAFNEPDYEFQLGGGTRFEAEMATWIEMGHAIAPRPLGDLKADAKAAITSHRWKVETGGVVLPNGMAVKTDKADQDRVTSVIVNAENAGIATVRFKAEHGFVTIDVATVRLIARAIALHVQACFSAEADHWEAVDALQTADEVLDYDFSAGWPGPAELESMLGAGPGGGAV